MRESMHAMRRLGWRHDRSLTVAALIVLALVDQSRERKRADEADIFSQLLRRYIWKCPSPPSPPR